MGRSRVFTVSVGKKHDYSDQFRLNEIRLLKIVVSKLWSCFSYTLCSFERTIRLTTKQCKDFVTDSPWFQYILW